MDPLKVMGKEQISHNDVIKFCFHINMISIVRNNIIQSKGSVYILDYAMDYERRNKWLFLSRTHDFLQRAITCSIVSQMHRAVRLEMLTS